MLRYLESRGQYLYLLQNYRAETLRFNANRTNIDLDTEGKMHSLFLYVTTVELISQLITTRIIGIRPPLLAKGLSVLWRASAT